MIRRLIGLSLLMISVVALLSDLADWYAGDTVALLSGNDLWLILDPEGYWTVQEWAGDYVSVVWEPIATPILALPAFVTSGALGLLFLWDARRTKAKKEYHYVLPPR